MITAFQTNSVLNFIGKKVILSLMLSSFMLITKTEAQEKGKNDIIIGLLCRQDNFMLGKYVFTEPLKFNAAPSSVITGRVLDEDGTGISNATVNLRGTAVSVITDTEGYYTLDLKNNPLSVLIVSASGFERVEKEMNSFSSSYEFVMSKKVFH